MQKRPSGSDASDAGEDVPVSRTAESKRLKVGDYFSETDYFRLERIDPPWFYCTTAKGTSIRMDAGVVDKLCYSADQFNVEKYVNRTKLVEIFTTMTGDKVFTVEFDKQLTPDVLDEHLQTTDYNKDAAAAVGKRRKILKDAMRGEPRKLIGYMKRIDTGMGRSDVYDLEQPDGKNTRQVDHRTLRSLILMGTKYTVK